MNRNHAILSLVVLTSIFSAAGNLRAQEIKVDAGRVIGRVSRYLTGACIEDVNHEIYGGIYSQMVFGESFQEPAPPKPINGFTAYGGRWAAKDGVLDADAGDGCKLIRDSPLPANGEVGVDLYLSSQEHGNAGL